MFDAALLGLDIRRLGRDDMREFLRIAGINIYDVLEETFESELLKGALALDAVLGTNLGPRSNNSVLALLHRLSGQAAGSCDGPALPEGGMGAVTEAIAASAASARDDSHRAPRCAITLDGDRVSGVQLTSGETVARRYGDLERDPTRTCSRCSAHATSRRALAQRAPPQRAAPPQAAPRVERLPESHGSRRSMPARGC
jgi:phytoene dehydrogenase-like protein